jgi:hypothetical protein
MQERPIGAGVASESWQVPTMKIHETKAGTVDTVLTDDGTPEKANYDVWLKFPQSCQVVTPT